MGFKILRTKGVDLENSLLIIPNVDPTLKFHRRLFNSKPGNFSFSDIPFCMMGGSSFEEDWELTSPRTLVLGGKAGNGKSATGNSILGKKRFQSKHSSSGVTSTSVLETTILDGQMLNVIDTPGLFDSSVDPEFIGKEIVNCINMARDGIHAFLVVISVRSRFSNEEKAAISSLLTLFGRKIYDYMIVVFTGGDELEEDDETLEDFLRDSPEALKETLCLCGNRCVLFDNRTKDQSKRAKQVEKLLSLVNIVSKENGGKPYTNEIFTELKKGARDFQEQTEKFQALKETKGYTEQEISVLTEQMRDEQFKRIIEMVESKLKETTLRLERLLAEERAARVKAEENAKAAEKKLEEEIREMREERERAKKRQLEERRRQLAEERAARVNSEEKGKAAEKKLDEGIREEPERAKEKQGEEERRWQWGKDDWRRQREEERRWQWGKDDWTRQLEEQLRRQFEEQLRSEKLRRQVEEQLRSERLRRQVEEQLRREAGRGCVIL